MKYLSVAGHFADKFAKKQCNTFTEPRQKGIGESPGVVKLATSNRSVQSAFQDWHVI